jgi:DNA-binding response OmpR family regulator
MKNRLQHMGYESDLVRSGEEALAIVAKQSYQFVFLDVMMEGLDGYKTCRAIKSNKARRGPPPIVVMLTSKGGTIDKIRGNMAGCDAYLTKPLNEKRLASVLAQFDSSTMTQRWQNLNPQTGMLKEMLAAKQ